MDNNKSSTSLFFEEFSRLLEALVTAPGSLLMAGDFNFHAYVPSDRDAQRFLRLLETFNLKQHINAPTHRSGHALDLVITRSDENVASKFDVYDPSVSDHFAVSCTLSFPKTSFERKEICCRKLKSIDMQTFRDEISNSALASPSSIVNALEQLMAVYDLTLSILVNKHAPLKTRIVTVRPSASWYNENIMTEKQKCRKLERRWRRTGLADDRVRFTDQCRVVNKCVEKARMDYYSGVIAKNQSLHRKSKAKLPHSEEHESLANAFADFFTDKITAIREELHLCRGGPAEPLVEVSYDGPKFECFKQVSCQELSNLLAKSSIKSCALDPIPATVLKGCLDLLLPFITKLVSCSLQCSVMTESMKQAQLRPLLKKPSLNHELFKNYRPISNLMFISKSCEKAVAVQLKDLVRNNNLDELFQSAYKAGHSTETALLRVQNDVLRAIDNGGCVMLLLLDLSAAFDTVDHSILLSRLSNSFGIAGAVYHWLQSYLSGRTQFVAVGNARSSCRPLTCGLP